MNDKEEDKPEAVVANGYMGDPRAWCWYDYEYPDEGACGPYFTRQEAIGGAKENGYQVTETRLTDPDFDSEVD